MRKITSVILCLILAMQILAVPTAVFAADEAKIFDAVSDEMPAGNLFINGDFDDASAVTNWYANRQQVTHAKADNGGYIQMSTIFAASTGFDLKYPDRTIPAGNYKFTGYFRMMYENEVTELQIVFKDVKGEAQTFYVYPTHDEWIKVELYITLANNFASLRVCGGDNAEFIQKYCVDNFSLVAVDAIPEDYTAPLRFGKQVIGAQAKASTNGSKDNIKPWNAEEEAGNEVKGIIINQDCDFVGTTLGGYTVEGLEKYARQFEGSHVTDYMINVFCQISVYPTELSMHFGERHRQYLETGHKIDKRFQAAEKMFEIDGVDYIDIWCKTFNEIGIRPWLSYRMNDAHTSDYEGAYDLHAKDPVAYRRVKHNSGLYGYAYWNPLLDYSIKEVRDYFLALINEGLSKYDCYGLELDWQRDIFLWYVGGEYEGLDTLNQFMRDIEDVVAIYEEKYGHEIKIGVRCATELETNYTLGLDVITWAAEGIIDLIVPTTRNVTTDVNIPVNVWTAVMHPFGVEVAPGIEYAGIMAGDTNFTGPHNLETLSAYASSWFAQGADKIYTFNYFRGYTSRIDPINRVTTTEDILHVGSAEGYWNAHTTIGSPDKLEKVNRRSIVSYDDIKPFWVESVKQLPMTISEKQTKSIRIAMGDIPEGATVTLRFSANNRKHIDNPPTVKIGFDEAEFVGVTYARDNYTANPLLCYEIPAAAYDDVYIVAEITPEQYISINYAEIYVDVNG